MLTTFLPLIQTQGKKTMASEHMNAILPQFLSKLDPQFIEIYDQYQ